ncbi:ATP-binding protein [Cohnella candidum]|uniref:histidine kinase n=1 Tax=Cohnella candidum TaxID=2674991 RepID=A0A3G3JSL3_9BACL|nr:ATP-binding protein [Cohnella candidum]AYQ71203.1 PAS domain S-box protein [Cohnella candidum]
MSKCSRIAGWIGILLLVLYVGWELFYRSDMFVGIVVSNVLQAMSALYAGIVLLLAYRQSGKSKFWLYYGIGALGYFTAQTYWTAELILTRGVPNAFGPAEIIWILQYFFILMGLYEQNRYRRNPAFPFLFDILLFTTVSVTLYWQQFIRPSLGEYDLTDAETIYNLFCSSVNLVILMFLFIFDRSRMPSGSRNFLAAAFLLKTVGSSSSWLLEGSDHWLSAGVVIPDFCWFAGLLFMGFAGAYGSRPHEEDALRKQPRATHLRRHVPLVFGGLLLVLLLAGSSPATPVAFGCLLGVILMLVRLFFGIRESESVNRSLKETDAIYQNWAENALVGVFIEQEGKLVYVNRYCEEIFGYEPGEMEGSSILSHISFTEIPRFLSEADKLHENIPTGRFGVTGLRRDQNVLYLEMHLAKSYFHGKEALSGTLIDITERKMSEQYLIRSEKLSVVGQLAAGVAHEIRNPLTALKGFTQLLHQNSDENRKYYEIMLTELERINYIVGEFMVLSKPHNRQQFKEHDIHRILTSIIPILESQAILHNVILRVETSQDLPKVKCDENQIKQVLINLMKNAIEAMPGGGTVTVRYETDAPKRQLTLYIEDEGVGMPAELLERLGEPFLTTKEKGTGLGLMVCYKIIQAHEGTLSVSSQPGQGTSVKLVLPAR